MTASQNSPLILSKTMAHDIVRYVSGSFAAEGPADYTEDELQTLARKLSYMVDADVQWTALDHLVMTIRELEKLERGTHPTLNISPSGSVNNSQWLLDNIQDRIKESVDYVLMTAHFRETYFESTLESLKLALA